MRTHISMKTWLIKQGNEDIGTIRAVGFDVGELFETDVGGGVETFCVSKVDADAKMIEVR